MSTDVIELKKKLGQLGEADRAELAYFLLGTLRGSLMMADDPALATEIERRDAEMESGEDPGEDAFEVIAELRKRFS